MLAALEKASAVEPAIANRRSMRDNRSPVVLVKVRDLGHLDDTDNFVMVAVIFFLFLLILWIGFQFCCAYDCTVVADRGD